MMRASAGTAAVMGLNNIEQICPPTTAYLLTEGICKRNCGFCGNNDRLARITWPRYNKGALLEKIQAAPFQRICLQTVESQDSVAEVAKVLPNLISTGKPVCLSSQFGEEYLAQGLDRWVIPLDVVVPSLYAKIKGGSFENNLARIKSLAKKYPGRIGTHVIAGLGESEEELLRFLAELYSLGLSVGLFAFTPVPHTPLMTWPKPALDSYRRVQIGNYLLWKDSNLLSELVFIKGRLVDAPLAKLESKAFETWGCPGCNRPFYNESPKGPIYNYPRTLSEAEFVKAIEESKLLNSRSR